MVAYEGTLQLSLHKDGAGLPPQGRTVRAGATLPPGGARLLFPGQFPRVLRRESWLWLLWLRLCSFWCLFAPSVVPVAIEYRCVKLLPLIVAV